MTSSNETTFDKLSRLFNSAFSQNEDQPLNFDCPKEIFPEINLKILVVGGHGVGKSTLIRRWASKPYLSQYTATIGIDKTIVPYSHQNNQINLHFWDVSSREINSPIDHLSLICSGVAGIFIVFNVNRISTITEVDAWREILGNYISSTEVPWILLSHKADLIEERVMSSDDLDAYCLEARYTGWFWTVGRTGLGDSQKKSSVNEALHRMVSKILEKGNPLKTTYNRNDLYIQPTLKSQLITSDSVLDEISAPILRLHTKAITTQAREETEQNYKPEQDTDFGAGWVLGIQERIERRNSFLQHELQVKRSNSMCTVNKSAIKEDFGWKHFAGTITRQRAEDYLMNTNCGTFLLRRKSPTALVLSYKAETEVRHSQIHYQDKKYYLGSKRNRAFDSLLECLTSVRHQAFDGLLFHKSVGISYQIIHQQTEEPHLSKHNISTIQSSVPVSSQGQPLVESTRSPRIGHWITRGSLSREISTRGKDIEYESLQSLVNIPNAERIYAISNDYYDQLNFQLERFRKESPISRGQQIETLIEEMRKERVKIHMNPCLSRLKSKAGEETNDSQRLEEIWRKLIRDMQIWKRITQNLEARILVDKFEN